MGQETDRPVYKDRQKDSSVTSVHRYRDFLGPRYWTTWMSIGMIHLIAYLPWRAKVGLAKLLTGGIKRFAKSRYRTLVRNIEVCFPDLTEADRAELTKKALFSNVFGIIETAHAWCRGTNGLDIEFEGLEHYQAARDSGRGVVILSGHFSFLDLGGALIGGPIKYGTIYRRHNNPLFNYFMTHSREAYIDYTLARKDVKGMIARLQQGDTLAYMPDQDFGKKRSVFVPFFGVQTATVTMTSKLIEAGNAVVIPFSGYRVGESNRYRVKIHAPMAIPSGDDAEDAKLWTRWLEDCVREHPDQYLWFHKRFKTRPDGEPSIY